MSIGHSTLSINGSYHSYPNNPPCKPTDGSPSSSLTMCGMFKVVNLLRLLPPNNKKRRSYNNNNKSGINDE